MIFLLPALLITTKANVTERPRIAIVARVRQVRDSIPLGQLAMPVSARTRTTLFVMGFSLEMPSDRGRQYIQRVENLQGVQDQIEADREVKELSTVTGELRAAQAQAYGRVVSSLNAIGAAPTLKVPFAQLAAQFSAPLVIPRDEKDDMKKAPDTAIVMSEIEEIQATSTRAADAGGDLPAYLKIAYGAEGLWDTRLGRFTADLHNALLNHESPDAASAAARDLLTDAPSSAPVAAIQALTLLSTPKAQGKDPGGTKLMLPSSSQLDPDTMLSAHRALLDTFDARGPLGLTEAAGADPKASHP